jgi:hypothetical protein
VYALERRLAKIEKKRGASHTAIEHPFNKMLVQLGEPPRASVSEAFLDLWTMVSNQAKRQE